MGAYPSCRNVGFILKDAQNRSGGTDATSSLRQGISRVKARVTKTKGEQVRSEDTKAESRALVTSYFEIVRRALVSDGLNDATLASLDKWMQDLLILTQKAALKKGYRTTLRAMEQALNGVELATLVKPTDTHHQDDLVLSGLDAIIATTLNRLVPTAGGSYEQACLDLRDSSRQSYRGAAAELREALRELLDHLAPDTEVTKQEGFKLEADCTGPTMRQKVRFIMRSRGKSKALSETPEAAVAAIEEKMGVLTRSVYKRSSISTHVGTTREETLQIKAYIDAVLADLLEITHS